MKFWIKLLFINKKVLKQMRELEQEIVKIVRVFINLQFSQLENEIDDVKTKLRYCTTYNEVILLALASSFVPNLCRYSGNPEIGYTLVSQRKSIQIYGSSSVSLVGLTAKSPEWILAYDLYTSERGKFFCKIAQPIDIDFLSNIMNNYAWKKYEMVKNKDINPYY